MKREVKESRAQVLSRLRACPLENIRKGQGARRLSGRFAERAVWVYGSEARLYLDCLGGMAGEW